MPSSQLISSSVAPDTLQDQVDIPETEVERLRRHLTSAQSIISELRAQRNTLARVNTAGQEVLTAAVEWFENGTGDDSGLYLATAAYRAATK
jgi:thiamine biosynthesis lipoprotein ApbE